MQLVYYPAGEHLIVSDLWFSGSGKNNINNDKPEHECIYYFCFTCHTEISKDIYQKFKRQCSELLYQYWACLYSFECIFHADFKSGNKNVNFEKFWKKKSFENADLSRATDTRMVRVICQTANCSIFYISAVVYCINRI